MRAFAIVAGGGVIAAAPVKARQGAGRAGFSTPRIYRRARVHAGALRASIHALARMGPASFGEFCLGLRGRPAHPRPPFAKTDRPIFATLKTSDYI